MKTIARARRFNAAREPDGDIMVRPPHNERSHRNVNNPSHRRKTERGFILKNMFGRRGLGSKGNLKEARASHRRYSGSPDYSILGRL